MWNTLYKNVKVLLNEGAEVLMKIANPGGDSGHLILRVFKKEGFIIAMKFDYPEEY